MGALQGAQKGGFSNWRSGLRNASMCEDKTSASLLLMRVRARESAAEAERALAEREREREPGKGDPLARRGSGFAAKTLAAGARGRCSGLLWQLLKPLAAYSLFPRLRGRRIRPFFLLFRCH